MERAQLLEKLKSLAVDTLEIDADKITEDASFADDLEADSLDLVELVMELEGEFDIRIPEEELEGVETVGQALDLVEQKLSVSS